MKNNKIHEQMDQAKQRALDDADGVLEDVNESLDFAIALVEDLADGKKDILSKNALMLDGYIAAAVGLTDILKNWEKIKDDLLQALGEDNEELMGMLPTFIMARTLQNFHKRATK